mmetsp:Transcript_83823/g.245774  ORF Transcript_83823/g.245774 Transcript_83823/m.245774 type:complete len:252 (-) Transcript_83823:122-877(-)
MIVVPIHSFIVQVYEVMVDQQWPVSEVEVGIEGVPPPVFPALHLVRKDCLGAVLRVSLLAAAGLKAAASVHVEHRQIPAVHRDRSFSLLRVPRQPQCQGPRGGVHGLGDLLLLLRLEALQTLSPDGLRALFERLLLEAGLRGQLLPGPRDGGAHVVVRRVVAVAAVQLVQPLAGVELRQAFPILAHCLPIILFKLSSQPTLGRAELIEGSGSLEDADREEGLQQHLVWQQYLLLLHLKYLVVQVALFAQGV